MQWQCKRWQQIIISRLIERNDLYNIIYLCICNFYFYCAFSCLAHISKKIFLLCASVILIYFWFCFDVVPIEMIFLSCSFIFYWNKFCSSHFTHCFILTFFSCDDLKKILKLWSWWIFFLCTYHIMPHHTYTTPHIPHHTTPHIYHIIPHHT